MGSMTESRMERSGLLVLVSGRTHQGTVTGIASPIHCFFIARNGNTADPSLPPLKGRSHSQTILDIPCRDGYDYVSLRSLR
jgi:hypothetical protein